MPWATSTSRILATTASASGTRSGDHQHHRPRRHQFWHWWSGRRRGSHGGGLTTPPAWRWMPSATSISRNSRQRPRPQWDAATGIISTIAGGGTNPGSDGLGDGGAPGGQLNNTHRRGGGCRRQRLHRGHRRQCHPQGVGEHGDISTIAAGMNPGSDVLGDGGPATAAESERPLPAWRWMPPATSTSRTQATMSSVRYRRARGSSPLSLAVAPFCQRGSGRRRGGYGGRTQRPPRRGGGCRRQPLHRGHRQQCHPRGNGDARGYQHCRRQRHAGYSGDGGRGHGGRTQRPQGVAVDAAGNLYIADTATIDPRGIGQPPGASAPSPATHLRLQR